MTNTASKNTAQMVQSLRSEIARFDERRRGVDYPTYTIEARHLGGGNTVRSIVAASAEEIASALGVTKVEYIACAYAGIPSVVRIWK